jgi:hypothetical protein
MSRCILLLIRTQIFVENSITVHKNTVHKNKCYCLIQCVLNLYPPLIAWHPLVGRDLLIVEASRSHSGTPHSVGLFEMSDHPDAETSLLDKTRHSQVRDIHAPGGFRTQSPGKRVPTDIWRTPYDHWCRLLSLYYNGIVIDHPLGTVHLLAQRIHRKFSRDIKVHCQKLPASKSVLFKTYFWMINMRFRSFSQQL